MADSGLYRYVNGVHFRYGIGGGTGPGVDTTPPTVPTNLRVTAVDTTSITIAWDGSSDEVGGTGVGRYETSLDGATPVSNGLLLSKTFNGLQPGTAHQLRVRAADQATPPNQSAFAQINQSTDPNVNTPPGAPPNLRQTGITQTSIALAWNAVADPDVLRYEVQTGAVTNPWVANGLTLSRNMTGLTAGTTYTFRVRAVDTANLPGPASSITLTTPGPVTTRTLIGMSSEDDQWATREASVESAGGRIECRRIFGGDVGSTTNRDLVAQAIAAGQYPIFSWKPAGGSSTWQQFASGARDSDLATGCNWLNTLAPAKLFVCIWHEPFTSGHPPQIESGETAAQWVAGQLHALQYIKDHTNGHVDVGVIGVGWIFNANGQGNTDAQIATVFPPALRQMCDVVAVDTYQAGSAPAGDPNAENAGPKMSKFAAWARRMGDVKGIGIGEFNGWGNDPGPDGPVSPRAAANINDPCNVAYADPLFKWVLMFNSARGGHGNVLRGVQLTAFQQQLSRWRQDGTPPPTFPTP